MSAFDEIRKHVKPGTELRTPDRATGKPFTVAKVNWEGVEVRTARGGKVSIGMFTFDTAVKFLTDHECRNDKWMPVKDRDFQLLLNMENDRVRAASYVISLLEGAGLIDVDGSRPNKVRLRSD